MSGRFKNVRSGDNAALVSAPTRTMMGNRYAGEKGMKSRAGERERRFTFLANNGVPDHIFARWVGHTNVKTTKRWYVKPDMEDLREAAATWDGRYGVPTQACEKL